MTVFFSAPASAVSLSPLPFCVRMAAQGGQDREQAERHSVLAPFLSPAPSPVARLFFSSRSSLLLQSRSSLAPGSRTRFLTPPSPSPSPLHRRLSVPHSTVTETEPLDEQVQEDADTKGLPKAGVSNDGHAASQVPEESAEAEAQEEELQKELSEELGACARQSALVT